MTSSSSSSHNEDKKWKRIKENIKKNGIDVHIANNVSSLYAMFLIVIFVGFTFMELVTYPTYEKYLEINGFFVYLYTISILFFVYLFLLIKQCPHSSSSSSSSIHESDKSHGSLAIRCGALVFGIATAIYSSIEFIDFLEVGVDSPCYHRVLGFNAVLSLVFIVCQSILLVVYPRLNLNHNMIMDQFGTMHVMATNFIIWIRTLIKESILEVKDAEEHYRDKIDHQFTQHLSEEYPQAKLLHNLNEFNNMLPKTPPVVASPSSHDMNCELIWSHISNVLKESEECSKHRKDILGKDTLIRSSPYLYPFIIEFVLIGVCVMYLMWTNMGRKGNRRNPVFLEYSTSSIRKPNPQHYIQKLDTSHSSKGLAVGIFIFMLNGANLGMFFGFLGHIELEDDAEFISKVINTIINLIGVIALISGIYEIQELNIRSKGENGDQISIDGPLISFTAFFTYLYLTFTVITGAFDNHSKDLIHVINGVTEMVQITLQIIFISDMKTKQLPQNEIATNKPGREITVFLFLFNLSQWSVDSFEIQKVRASIVEANFYGLLPWILIQRITLPLAIFFRFHSAVINIELWKDIYKENSTMDNDDDPRRRSSSFLSTTRGFSIDSNSKIELQGVEGGGPSMVLTSIIK